MKKTTSSSRRKKSSTPKDYNTFRCPVDKIKIGPFDYELRWCDDADYSANMRHGQHEGDYHIIWAASTMGKWGMLDTLFHEINHAIEHVFGFGVEREEKDEDKEKKYRTDEEHCSCIASGWVMIHRDNPEFRNWINNLFKEEEGN